MYFDSLADFLAMGRHAPYVWSAWGVTLAIVVWNVVQPWRLRRRLLREQAALLRRELGAGKPAAPRATDGNDSPVP